MIKIFETNDDYNIYTLDNTSLLSDILYYVKEDNTGHFYTNNIDGESKIYDLGGGGGGNTDPRLIVKYNVTNASTLTKLYYYHPEAEAFNPSIILGVNMFDKVEIDGTEVLITDLDAAGGKYQLSVGEHVVKYTMKNPTQTEQRCFMQCTNVVDVIIPNSVTTIGAISFGYTSLKNIIIPNNVTTINGSAFTSCDKLESVDFGNGVTSIGNQSFYSCTSLSSIKFSDNLISIGNEVFVGCNSIINIEFPSNITSLGQNILYNCINLTTIIIKATTPPSLGSMAFNYSLYKIFVPTESVDTYKSASGWSSYSDKIQAIP